VASVGSIGDADHNTAAELCIVGDLRIHIDRTFTKRPWATSRLGLRLALRH